MQMNFNQLRSEAWNCPWKVHNEVLALWSGFTAFLQQCIFGLPWQPTWKFYGLPTWQLDKRATVQIGSHFIVRCAVESNPLVPWQPTLISVRGPHSSLSIGHHCSITGGSIVATKKISIGNHVMIGSNCLIMDSDFHSLNYHARQQTQDQGLSKPIVIKDHVFIGTQAVILKGVTIGRGAVVGARSVVTKSVPAGAVVAGNPAVVLRKKTS